MDEEFKYVHQVPGLSFRRRRTPNLMSSLEMDQDRLINLEMAAMAGAAIDPLIGITGTDNSAASYSRFMNRSQMANTFQGRAENALLGSGNPTAMGVGAALKGLRAIDNKLLRGDDGLYRSNAAKWVSSIVNPTMLVRNIASGEMFGSRALRRDMNLAKLAEENEKILRNQQVGAQIQNSIPRFQAPAYGRRGMKFRTKFSKRDY